jgi:hypothetical protein
LKMEAIQRKQRRERSFGGKEDRFQIFHYWWLILIRGNSLGSARAPVWDCRSSYWHVTSLHDTTCYQFLVDRLPHSLVPFFFHRPWYASSPECSQVEDRAESNKTEIRRIRLLFINLEVGRSSFLYRYWLY